MYGANTTSELRGDYRRAREDFTVDQAWHSYSEADQQLWQRLYARQSAQVATDACREFREGLALTDCAAAIPELARVNVALAAASGWQLVAVPGFIPDLQFFRHLAARRFPVTVWLRTPEEFDYLVEPDIFHDFFGHVPMLFHRRYADYMQRFGMLGLQALEQDALALIGRLYWYTVEFGLLENAEGLRSYGAGILSSAGETRYSLDSPQPLRLRFDLERIMRTRYRIDAYQKTYFVISSIDELLMAVDGDLGAVIERVRTLPELEPDRSYPGDIPTTARGQRHAA